MCPNMCFAIAVCINREFNESLIADTVQKISRSHPFIRALLSHEEKDNRFFYDVKKTSQAQLLLYHDNVEGIDDPEVMAEYERLTARDFDLYKEGMLKISAWPSGVKTVVLMTIHHLLADGRGALELAREFADYYVLTKEPAYVREKLISSTAELPLDSNLPLFSRMLVNQVNRMWKKEKRQLSYRDYHRFADEFLKDDIVKHELSAVEKSELSEIVNRCREEKVTVNDYLLAKLFIEAKTERIVMAADIRDYLKCYNSGAMGNYSTAFSVKLKNAGNDVYKAAGKVHEAVRRIYEKPSAFYLVLQCYAALNPGLLDGAMMASRGWFESKAAELTGRMFFQLDKSEGYSVTNLGKTESVTIEDACFIPPASPAMKKTLGVLTVNGRMRICTSER